MPTIVGQAGPEWALTDDAFSRAAGARLSLGNRVRLLRDAEENYPAWLEAITTAERYVHFESYIIRDDVSGRRFAEALMAKARDGVPVRLLYDWMGALGKTPRRFWAALRGAGVEVRCFNPLRPGSPLGWIHRDHRKCLVADGQVGFVTGLCVGDAWAGDPARGVAPWRDTGIEIRGPAVAEIERAFLRIWGLAGPPAPEARDAEDPPAAGDVAVRIVASEPNQAGLLRVDQLVAAAARDRLWLTDAYFAGLPSYVQALRAAALDGVDVRLLVPGGTDIPVLRPLSRAGYRPLLQGGVRVFEWNGPMLHAKTAVADRRWARVGSSNLNVASWLGNYELDAVVEDTRFAADMERQYLEDLTRATEVVLHTRRWLRPRSTSGGGDRAERRQRSRGGGSAGRAVAGAVRLGNTVTAAVTDHRVLASADAEILGLAGLVLLVLAAAAVVWPWVLAWPLAGLLAWIGTALVARAWRLRRRRQP
jgi:cardiolipin synthase